MNIAFFTDYYSPTINGIAISIVQLATAFRALGHSVLIVCPKYPGAIKTEPHVLRLPSIKYDQKMGIYLGLPVSLEMFEEIEQFQPTVVHIHTPGTVGLTGFLVSKLKNIPSFCTCHTDFASPDYQYYVGALANTKLGYMAAKSVYTLMSNLVDINIAPSAKIRHALEAENCSKPIIDIPNGIDLTPFPTKLSPRTQPHLIYVGRLEPEKHVELLLQSLALLVAPIPRITLTIVGDGICKSDLVYQTKKLGLGKHVTFAGTINHSHIPKLLSQASLFVTASTSEVHPLTLIEALAAGLPIVAPADPAYDSILLPNQTGLFCEQTPASLAQAISTLLSSPTKLTKLSSRAHSHSRRFSIHTQATSLLSLYST